MISLAQFVQAEGPENNVTIAPGGQSQAGELE